jgi:hypothetical protein
MPNEPIDTDDQQAQDRSWTPQPDGPAQERALQQHQGQGQNQGPKQSGGGVSGLGDSDGARQQGGASDQGQQRQFDTQGGGQQGGGGGDRFADQIREHQDVIDDAGNHVGTVDHVDGDRIKLARSDSSDGQHHYVSLSQVAGIEGDKVRLRERGDNDFGQEAS